MQLNKAPATSIVYKGKTYQLTPYFDHVLTAIELLRDKTLLEVDRIDTALSCLVRGSYPVDYTLLESIFQLLSEREDKPGKKVFDFQQDAQLIYAAFWQTYGIDLYAQRGKLHWSTFCALLAGIPDNTRFSQVIDIRTRPLPKPTKYNAQEIQQLQQQKAKFALRTSPEEAAASVQDALVGLANNLIQIAKGR